MNILLAVLAAPFAAICVWLMVRIVNRRERWAKWTLVAALAIPLLYVASFGPACWITMNRQRTHYVDAPRFYWLLGTAVHHTGHSVWDSLTWYAGLMFSRRNLRHSFAWD